MMRTPVVAMSLLGALIGLRADAQLCKKGLLPSRSRELGPIVKVIKRPEGLTIPARCSLEREMPPCGDQGSQASAAAFAAAYCLRSYLERRSDPEWQLESGTDRARIDHVFSPAFIYNQRKLKYGDNGMSLAEALGVLRDRGAATLLEMPYDAKQNRKEPGPEMAKAALGRRIAEFAQADLTRKGVKLHIIAGEPVIVASVVDRNFEGLRGDNDTWKVLTKPTGLHALVIIGYDDQKHAFLVQNSWGADWGDHGRGWIDYDLMFKDVAEPGWSSIVREGYVARIGARGIRRSHFDRSHFSEVFQRTERAIAEQAGWETGFSTFEVDAIGPSERLHAIRIKQGARIARDVITFDMANAVEAKYGIAGPIDENSLRDDPLNVMLRVTYAAQRVGDVIPLMRVGTKDGRRGIEVIRFPAAEVRNGRRGPIEVHLINQADIDPGRTISLEVLKNDPARLFPLVNQWARSKGKAGAFPICGGFPATRPPEGDQLLIYTFDDSVAEQTSLSKDLVIGED